jgi:tetratricopeptide (TPR) repeat protein
LRVEAAGGPSLLDDETRRTQAFDICSRLDGLPLALELAASRVAHLGAPEVLRRLDDRFRLLAGGLRTAEARQQTLRAVVDWSWDLLDGQERLVFARFSVFAGSGPLDAAEEVCAGDGVAAEDVAAVLVRLGAKSLLSVDRSGPRPRFGMLQTLADYGRWRLAESGEEDRVRRRHARWAARLVAGAETGLRSSAQLEWLPRVAVELDNIRTAVGWLTMHDPSAARARAAARGGGCYLTHQAPPGGTLLSTGLGGSSGPAIPRARALAFAATLGKLSGHLEEAARYGEEAEAAIPPDAPPAVLGSVLAILALADVQSGAVQSVQDVLGRARTCFQGDADRWWVGYVDVAEAIAALYDGRASEALEHLDRSVATMRTVGDEWMALMALVPRAYVDERYGRLGDAAAALEEGLGGADRFRQALEGTPVRLALVTIARARLALIRGAQGRFREAVHLADRAVEEAGLGSPSGVAIAYQARGRALLGLGRRDEGRHDLERAARLFRDLGVGIAVAECLVDVGRSWLEDGDPSAAVTVLEQAQADAAGTEDRHTMDDVLGALAQARAAARSFNQMVDNDAGTS